MEIKLIGKIPKEEKIIAAGSRGTRENAPASELIMEIDSEKASSIDHLIVNQYGHDAITEFSFYIFSISGISRVLTHQLVRHRIASYLQMSSRHISLADHTYEIPKKIKDNKKAYDLFTKTIEQNNNAYKKLIEYGISYQDARYLIPSGIHTNIVLGINARSLNNFFKLRLCRHAQWEIRELAEKLREIVKREAPVLFLKAEKPCVIVGKCIQEKGSCKYISTSNYKKEKERYLKEKKKYDKLTKDLNV